MIYLSGVETALCKDTRGLELGSFRIDSESKYPPNAQHFNAVREIHQGTRELATRSLIEGKVLKIPRFDISARGESDTLGGPNIIYPLSEDAKGVPGDDRSKISGEGIVGTFHFDNDIRTEMPSAAGKKSGQILADPNDDQSVKGTEGGENATSSNELSDCAPCDCTNSVVTTKVIHQQVEYEHGPNQQQNSHTYLVDVNKNGDPTMKTIFVITPTYHRVTQKIDLNSMCHTLMLVPKVVWIIIEDSKKPTDVVSKLIQRCKVKTVHLVVPTSSAYRVKKGAKNRNMPRGVEQRNAGLHWLRDNYSLDNCSGVFYFGDDDNKYDLRLFEDVSILLKSTLPHLCSLSEPLYFSFFFCSIPLFSSVYKVEPPNKGHFRANSLEVVPIVEGLLLEVPLITLTDSKYTSCISMESGMGWRPQVGGAYLQEWSS